MQNIRYKNLSLFSVNSEANARRIAMVENCFGSSGQVRFLGFVYISKYSFAF